VLWRSKCNYGTTDLVVEKASVHAEILNKFEEDFILPASENTSSQATVLLVKLEEARIHYYSVLILI
jgi:hypothetical protein